MGMAYFCYAVRAHTQVKLLSVVIYTVWSTSMDLFTMFSVKRCYFYCSLGDSKIVNWGKLPPFSSTSPPPKKLAETLTILLLVNQ